MNTDILKLSANLLLFFFYVLIKIISNIFYIVREHCHMLLRILITYMSLLDVGIYLRSYRHMDL